MTPFEIFYGRPRPTILTYPTESSPVSPVDQQLKDRDLMIETLQAHLHTAQQRMSAYANAKRREMALEIKDWAYLKLKSTVKVPWILI